MVAYFNIYCVKLTLFLYILLTLQMINIYMCNINRQDKSMNIEKEISSSVISAVKELYGQEVSEKMVQLQNLALRATSRWWCSRF